MGNRNRFIKQIKLNLLFQTVHGILLIFEINKTMEGFGYKNWNSGAMLEDSYESSPPTYNSNESYGFGTKSKPISMKKNYDMYDFDISQEEDSPQFKSSSTRRSSTTDMKPLKDKISSNVSNFKAPTRRMSTDERTAEIMNKYKFPETSTIDFKGTIERGNNLKAEWEKIISNEPPKEKNSTTTRKPTPEPLKKNDINDYSFGDSDLGDSLEISATDFEVGALAARRSQEKANSRSRRKSFDPSKSPQSYLSPPRRQRDATVPPKLTESPDVGKLRRERDNKFDAPMHTALSSIRRTSHQSEDVSDHSELLRYGSVDQSDGDLLKTLASVSSFSSFAN